MKKSSFFILVFFIFFLISADKPLSKKSIVGDFFWYSHKDTFVLKLKKNGTFNFNCSFRYPHSSVRQVKNNFGRWKLVNNNLILNSKKLPDVSSVLKLNVLEYLDTSLQKNEYKMYVHLDDSVLKSKNGNKILKIDTNKFSTFNYGWIYIKCDTQSFMVKSNHSLSEFKFSKHNRINNINAGTLGTYYPFYKVRSKTNNSFIITALKKKGVKAPPLIQPYQYFINKEEKMIGDSIIIFEHKFLMKKIH